MLLTSPTARIVSSAGGISLAALIAISGVVNAAPLPTFGYSLMGDELTANVTGDIRTGVWRIRLVSPSGDKRIEFMLQKGDVSWSGAVRVSRRLGNSWSLVSRHRLDDALMGGPGGRRLPGRCVLEHRRIAAATQRRWPLLG